MKFLITVHYLRSFTGSEIHTYQISKALSAMGHSVEVAAFITAPPLLDMLQAIGVRVVNLLEEDDSGADRSSPQQYDVIWAHHAPVLTHLLFKRNIANTRILFNSLSSFEPLEFPPPYFTTIPLYLILSYENQQVLVNYGIPSQSILLFPNYAPQAFFNQCKSAHAGQVKKIAVVSNHIPPEVLEFARLAGQQDIQVDFIGQQPHSRPVFVDEQALLPYDLVITIGKTVQYCFALKIPVYVYDHFGGSGYVHAGNFTQMENTNFSGRDSFRKLSAGELLDEVVRKYPAGVESVDFLYQVCREKFCLETNLQAVIDRITDLPAVDISKIKADYFFYERLNDTYVKELRNRLDAYDQIFTREEMLKRLYQDLAERDSVIAATRQTLNMREQTLQDLNQELEQQKQISKALQHQLDETRARLQHLSQQLEESERSIQELQQTIYQSDTTIFELQQTIHQNDTTILELTQTIAAHESRIQGLQQTIFDKEQQFSALLESKTWKLARALNRVRCLFAPDQSIQYRIIRRIYHLLRRN